MSEEFIKENRRYNLNLMTGCLVVIVLLAIGIGAMLLLALRVDRRAAQYPDSVAISTHSNYKGLPNQFRWDNTYRTSDDFNSVYNWYSTTFDLGSESRAAEKCILLEGSRKQFIVERQTTVFLCNTPDHQLIFVTRFTTFR
jgi:hypothetical protein